MSQHIFNTSHEGQPVTIMMGWDRPLQGYFLVVMTDDEAQERYIYSNLKDPVLTGCNGLPESIEYFCEKLTELGIEVPAEMLEGVEMDGIFNVGNKIAHYALART